LKNWVIFSNLLVTLTISMTLFVFKFFQFVENLKSEINFKIQRT